MASVYMDEVFDAMNCSQCVGSVVSYNTVKRRSNIRSINTTFTMGITVTDKYFLIISFATNLFIQFLSTNNFICISKFYFYISKCLCVALIIKNYQLFMIQLYLDTLCVAASVLVTTTAIVGTIYQ